MEPTTSTPTSSEHSILSVITYFDLFSYPLTPYEIWKWAYHEAGEQPLALRDVFRGLAESAYLRERLDAREGFFFLRGQKGHVMTRKERYLLAERKYRRVLKAVRAFRFLPFIRAIAVCNSLAYSNTREDGDLDLLIITAPNKIWTVRFLTTGLAKLLGWRPTQEHARDGICLSFFLSESHLDLRSILRKPDDIYLHYWLDQLVLVYGDVAVLDALRAQNAWSAIRVPNAYGVVPGHRRRLVDTLTSRAVRGLFAFVHGGAVGRFLEGWYRSVQRNVLPLPLRLLAEQEDSRVVMNDAMLKFHENDRRALIAEQFAHRLAEVV